MAKPVKKSRVAAVIETPNHKKAPEAVRRNGHGESESNGGVENLDKVRDILFGSQIRDNERRFARLEERVAKETTDLREESRKRLESLDVYVRKEMQSLLERVKGEQTQRADGLKEIAQELKEAGKTFQARANELQEEHAESLRTLRQEILDQSKGLRDELQKMRLATAGELENAIADLRTQKVDRGTLADLFTEIGARLAEQE